ncbi:MAG: hypothetical protein AB1631_31355 [Acidobacteriota bacterium]
MRSKLFLAVFFMLLIPLFNSPLKVSSSISATPYSGIAFAGHAGPGNVWCECSCPECAHATLSTDGSGSGGFSKDTTQSETTQSEAPADYDFGADALLIALLFLLWI